MGERSTAHRARAGSGPLSTAAGVAATASLGAVGWTALEYLLHRFAMHELRGKGLASREHLKHHADVTYFSPTSKKLLSAAATTSVVLPLSWRAVGRRRSLSFTGGLIGMYFAYEVLHRRTHTHPPRTAYGRWMRRSHLYHHFGGPMRNIGVTTPVWDRLAGTYDDPGVVTVPRRMAPDWMLDETGELRPAYVADYVVRGTRRPGAALVARDRDDAFANRPPTTDERTTDEPGGDGSAAEEVGSGDPVLDAASPVVAGRPEPAVAAR